MQDLAFLLATTIFTISLALCGGFPASPIIPFCIQWISPVNHSLQSIVIPLLTGTSAERLLDGAGMNTPAITSENVAILVVILIDCLQHLLWQLPELKKFAEFM